MSQFKENSGNKKQSHLNKKELSKIRGGGSGGDDDGSLIPPRSKAK